MILPAQEAEGGQAGHVPHGDAAAAHPRDYAGRALRGQLQHEQAAHHPQVSWILVLGVDTQLSPCCGREEPESYNSYRPPNYYGSGRMEEEFSECESLVNGVTAGTMAQMGHPPHPHQGGRHSLTDINFNRI